MGLFDKAIKGINTASKAIEKKAKDIEAKKSGDVKIGIHHGNNCYEYDIVGEAPCREHLQGLIKKHKAQRIGEILTDAVVVPEPTNMYDKNAIRVLIEGKPVGYIPKNDCLEWLDIFKKNGIGGMQVKARIGWDSESHDPPIGVQLDVEWTD